MTIKRLRSGASNASDVPGGVLQRSNIHVAVCPAGTVGETLKVLKASPAAAKAKAKFVLATDGEMLEVEELATGDGVTCSGNGVSDLPNAEALTQRAIAAGMEEIARIQASEPELSDDEQLQCMKYVRAGFDSPALYESRQGAAAIPPTLELREAAYIEYAKAKLSRNYRDCTARIHQANQAEAKRAEAAEARQKLTELALAHRDPSDVVAQVLNYTTFGADDGIGDSAFWWRDPSKGTCLYRLHYVLSVDWGPCRFVKHEGREIMAHRMQTLLLGDGRRDLDRLARGWALIYGGKCKGSKKLF